MDLPVQGIPELFIDRLARRALAQRMLEEAEADGFVKRRAKRQRGGAILGQQLVDATQPKLSWAR
jgi:hypothetical protein